MVIYLLIIEKIILAIAKTKWDIINYKLQIKY